MRLLILGANYAPEITGIAPFTTGLAEHLASRGHEVTVATTFPYYPQWRVQMPYMGRWRTTEQRASVKVRRSRIYLPRRRSALERIWYDSSVAVSALLNTFTLSPVEAVFCVSPPIQLGITGAMLAQVWRVPLVLRVQDLPLELAVAVGLLRHGLVYNIGRRFEQCVYRCANRISVVGSGFRDHLLRLGVSDQKISVIPDWAETDAIRPLPPAPAVRRFLGAGSDNFLVLHTGNMGEKQGLENALAAAQLLQNEGLVKLTLAGDGFDRPRLEELVATQRLDNVSLLPLQAAEMVPRMLVAADALLLNQRAGVVDSVVPSKLLAYMAAGRAVVAAVHARSEAARVVAAADCGLLVEPGDASALAEAVIRLKANPVLRAQLGANGRRHVEQHYARDRVLGRHEAFFSDLLQVSFQLPSPVLEAE